MRKYLLPLLLLLVTRPVFAQADLVARVKDALVLQGQTFTTNCDAFEITRRVAWLLRAQGAQLVGKNPSQNGCQFGDRKYSHDAIAFPTGWRDILHSAGPPANANEPAWDLTGTDPNAPLYAPADPGDVAPGPTPTPVPAPTPEQHSCSLSGIVYPTQSCFEIIVIEARAHADAEAIEREKAEAFRQAVGHEYAKFFKMFATRILPIVGGILAGWKGLN